MTNQQQPHAQPSHALLPRWANDQDGWPRTIAGDVLKNRVQAADLDIDRYLKLLLSEKKLSDEPFQAVPKIEEKQLDGNLLEAVRIDSLRIGDGRQCAQARRTNRFRARRDSHLRRERFRQIGFRPRFETGSRRQGCTLLPQIERRVSDAKWVTRATIVKAT